jgi:hypothetical protein
MALKEYSGYETKNNGTLIEKLESLNEDTTLFVADYYFVLQTKSNLFFYLNPCYFIGEIKADEIDSSVLDFLKNNCSQFKNILKAERNLEDEIKWEESSITFPETPNLGNQYSSLGNRIVTTNGNFIFFGSFGGAKMTSIKNIGVNEIMDMLYFAVTTKSPNTIKSMTELNCFLK